MVMAKKTKPGESEVQSLALLSDVAGGPFLYLFTEGKRSEVESCARDRPILSTPDPVGLRASSFSDDGALLQLLGFVHRIVRLFEEPFE